MYRVLLLVGSILAFATAAVAQQQKQATDPFAEIRKAPLRFYVARGDDNACGPNCSEWIAAEGYFDAGAAARFQTFLTRLGSRKLPIFFHSGGGLWQPAQAVGRAMRERNMTAGVARTLPVACVGADVRSCEATKRSGKDLDAHWSSAGAQCNSACTYALIGAGQRIAPLGSSLGIHSSRQVCAFNNGAVALDAKDPRCKEWLEKIKAEQRRYVQQMGIDLAFFELASQTPYEDIRLLSREEIVRFGIDRSQIWESPWMIVSENSAATMMKYVIEANRGTDVRWGAIQIACPSFGTLFIKYYRLSTQTEKEGNFSIAVSLNGHKYYFPANHHYFVRPIKGIDPFAWGTMHQLWIPASSIDPALLSIEIGEKGRPARTVTVVVGPSTDDHSVENREKNKNSSSLVIRPSTHGFLRAWKAVSSSCATPDNSQFLQNYKPFERDAPWSNELGTFAPKQ